MTSTDLPAILFVSINAHLPKLITVFHLVLNRFPARKGLYGKTFPAIYVITDNAKYEQGGPHSFRHKKIRPNKYQPSAIVRAAELSSTSGFLLTVW